MARGTQRQIPVWSCECVFVILMFLPSCFPSDNPVLLDKTCTTIVHVSCSNIYICNKSLKKCIRNAIKMTELKIYMYLFLIKGIQKYQKYLKVVL
jgi:hypothetical protein